MLRPYQQRAVDAVVAAGRRTHRVCLVAPTGAGKTRMGLAIARRSLERGRRVVWLAHRRELVEQAQRQCAELVCTTVQAACLDRPEADLLVLDECHHYAADEWSALADSYPERTPILGLTATPERADGRPLAGVFGALVVAAHYSELVAEGHLVPCRVVAPPAPLSGEIAQTVVESYGRWGESRRGFVFCSSVAAAEDTAGALRGAGVPAIAVSDSTPRLERQAAVSGLASGVFRLLCNAYLLTEGIDIPAASVAILARPVRHASNYLQMAGRVLRPAPGKTDALLIDLAGSALIHGLPTSDRDYSLGDGIQPRSELAALHQCLQCGHCWEGSARACPECGWEPPLDERSAAGLAIAGVPIADVTAHLEAAAVKREVYRQLRARQREAGHSLYWLTQSYLRATGDKCIVTDATKAEKMNEHRRLTVVARERGWLAGAISHRYRDVFGVWPKGVS